jgi:hypothetical protein
MNVGSGVKDVGIGVFSLGDIIRPFRGILQILSAPGGFLRLLFGLKDAPLRRGFLFGKTRLKFTQLRLRFKQLLAPFEFLPGTLGFFIIGDILGFYENLCMGRGIPVGKVGDPVLILPGIYIGMACPPP